MFGQDVDGKCRCGSVDLSWVQETISGEIHGRYFCGQPQTANDLMIAEAQSIKLHEEKIWASSLLYKEPRGSPK